MGEHIQPIAIYFKAGGEGFEPPHTDSESAVLPLDEPPMLRIGILPSGEWFVKFELNWASLPKS